MQSCWGLVTLLTIKAKFAQINIFFPRTDLLPWAILLVKKLLIEIESCKTVTSVFKVDMDNKRWLRFLDFQLFYYQNYSGKEIGLCFTCANLALVTFFCKRKQTFAALYGLGLRRQNRSNIARSQVYIEILWLNLICRNLDSTYKLLH